LLEISTFLSLRRSSTTLLARHQKTDERPPSRVS
jgi:hypothetical protein